jgi:hypothetical protein
MFLAHYVHRVALPEVGDGVLAYVNSIIFINLRPRFSLVRWMHLIYR